MKNYRRFACIFNYIRDGVKCLTLCVFILWLCSKSKPYNPPLRNAKDIVINSELAVLPKKLCIIWTATRDLKQRKFYYPLNYRYGLNLQVNQKLSHVVLLILLAGDVSTIIIWLR